MRKHMTDLSKIDWNDIISINSITVPILLSLSDDKGLLRNYVESVLEQPYLAGLCEHYDILDKIVIYEDPTTGARARLHIFSPGYFDRPHNHRWSYSTKIITGRYQHFLYGNYTSSISTLNLIDLAPILVRDELPGNIYTLSHSMVHSVIAEPYTVSLVIRGPSVKESFMIADRESRVQWWQYGAKDESAEMRATKAMSQQQLNSSIALLEQLNVI